MVRFWTAPDRCLNISVSSTDSYNAPGRHSYRTCSDSDEENERLSCAARKPAVDCVPGVRAPVLMSKGLYHPIPVNEEISSLLFKIDPTPTRRSFRLRYHEIISFKVVGVKKKKSSINNTRSIVFGD